MKFMADKEILETIFDMTAKTKQLADFTYSNLCDIGREISKNSEIITILLGATISLLIIGVIIILNQRKIRKELRQLREMMENQDKPNGETYESDTE